MSPGSLSFAKLVMMSSAPAKSAPGDARYASQIHSFNVVPYNLDSNPYKKCVLPATLNAMKRLKKGFNRSKSSFYLELFFIMFRD